MIGGLLEANGWQGVVDAGVVSPCPRRFSVPYGAAIRPGQLVLLSAKDSVKAYMRGADLGCDPASWFSVADASMGKDSHQPPQRRRKCDTYDCPCWNKQASIGTCTCNMYMHMLYMHM